MYTVQFRNLVNPRVFGGFSVLSDAIDYGARESEAFDVSGPAGEIVWAWEELRVVARSGDKV